MAASDAFYLEIVDEVTAIIQEFGTMYSIRSHGVYDPNTLSNAPNAPREVFGLVASQQVAHSLGSIAFPVTEGSAVWVATKTLLLLPDADPKPEEEVLVDGEWYPLATVQSVKPADIVVLYMLGLSR